MDITLIVGSLFIAFLIYYVLNLLKRDRVSKMIDPIPGPLKLPLIGTTYRIIFTPREDLMKNSRKMLANYGSVVKTWLGNYPVVHLLAPEYIELILGSSVNINKSLIYDLVRPWLGDGLLTSTGQKWHSHRKIITPTFHFKILDNFMEVFVEKSRLLTEQLKTKANGEVFDLYPYITRCTLDIICETAMGVQINALSNPNNEYVRNVYEISKAVVDRMIKPWLHPDFIYYNSKPGKQFKRYLKGLHDFTNKVIKERRETLLLNKSTNTEIHKSNDDFLNKKVRKAFLDLLLEAPSGLTDIELREEVDTFMFEGHDTTTAGISWSLFLLGNHPEIQEELYKEIKTVFEESGDNLTISDLGKLKLLERCVKEALRLYPSVPVISRNLTQDIKTGDYIIPSGCTVNVQIHLLHRDETIYPEPDKYDPDRFLPENIKDRHPYAYVPFSAGPRNCIGQKFAMYEEKTLLAYILRNYKVIAMETQETIKPMMELVLKPKNGLLVKLVPREI